MILYYHNLKLAIVADGANLYHEDEVAKKVVASEFAGIEIINSIFLGQNMDNRCDSSAVAIVLEFQKLQMKKEIPAELRPPKVTFERINNVLHKVETERITEWKPIDQRQKGVMCPRCAKNFRNAKNRNILNFHKC